MNTNTFNLNQLPNLIFIDGVPSKLLGGISQTLYNLFDGYPANKLYAICDKKQLKEITDSSLKAKVIKLTYTSFEFKYKPFNYFNSFIKYLDLSFRELFVIKYLQKNKLPSTGILFLCTSNIEKIQLAKQVFQCREYKLVTYYMDDWMSDYQYNWLNGSLQDYIKWSLDAALGNLMISEQLAQTLKFRYNQKIKPSLVLHNPVDIICDFGDQSIEKKTQSFNIAYAGSIWPMHKDAIIECISAIDNINNKKQFSISLDIYCKEIFWNMNFNYFNKKGVHYRGFVDYDNLYNKLKNYDLLLVASSFLEENKSFSLNSIQTKITDYLNFKVPILSVGPSYSASNQFIKKWACGYIWDEKNKHSLEEYMIEILNDHEQSKKHVENGTKILISQFDKKVVQVKLFKFIKNL